MKNSIVWALIWCGTQSAYAHGGPPFTRDVLLGPNRVSLVTTHGFFSDQDAWAWVCDEATGADIAASIIRNGTHWAVGTLAGVRLSQDGCHWYDDPNLAGRFIIRVFSDVIEPDRIWAVTHEGLWRIDGGQNAILEHTAPMSLRDAIQGPNGDFMMVGFEGSTPVFLSGGAPMVLPTTAGRMQFMTVDDNDRVYIRFPAGDTDQLLRISGREIEALLPFTSLIYGVFVSENRIYVLQRAGITSTVDDGKSWSPPRGLPLQCLRAGPEGFYGCPFSRGEAALLFSPSLAENPEEWTWEVALNFSDTTGHVCGPTSSVGRTCPIFWPTVQGELGLLPELKDLPTGNAAAPVDRDGGCALSKGTASSDSILWLLLLTNRRRRQRLTTPNSSKIRRPKLGKIHGPCGDGQQQSEPVNDRELYWKIQSAR